MASIRDSCRTKDQIQELLDQEALIIEYETAEIDTAAWQAVFASEPDSDSTDSARAHY